MASLLPSHPGLLPYFLLYESFAAFAHSIACYLMAPTTAITIFSGPRHPQLSPLLAHTYAVKNVYTALIRGYAAYHITNPELYHLAIASLVGVFWLYSTECFYYRTVNLNMRGAVIPLVMSSTGLVWMIGQRSWYLQ